MRTVPLRDYSSSYFILPSVDVREYSGSKIAAGQEFYSELKQFVRRPPVLKIGNGGHYWLRPEYGIPADTVTVPKDSNVNAEPEMVLMAHDDTTTALRQRGLIRAP